MISTAVRGGEEWWRAPMHLIHGVARRTWRAPRKIGSPTMRQFCDARGVPPAVRGGGVARRVLAVVGIVVVAVDESLGVAGIGARWRMQ